MTELNKMLGKNTRRRKWRGKESDYNEPLTPQWDILTLS